MCMYVYKVYVYTLRECLAFTSIFSAMTPLHAFSCVAHDWGLMILGLQRALAKVVGFQHVPV